jgi:SAM-dependent methyltransferase
MNDVTFSYGHTHVLTSARLQNHPRVAKFIYSIWGYTSFGNWARAMVFLSLLRLLPLKRFKKIMDLGAGLGEFSFMMSEALPDAQITALEILPSAIDKLRNVVKKYDYRNVTVFPHKIEELNENGTFDFIFSVDVFEHILPEEMPFSESYKKLKPGGYFLVKMPAKVQRTILPDSWFEDHNEWLEGAHIGQVLTLEDLVQKFKEAGFRIVHASYSDGWLSRLAWELGYLTSKGGAIPKLLALPFCKFLNIIDRMTFRSKKHGNAIQVIGVK